MDMIFLGPTEWKRIILGKEEGGGGCELTPFQVLQEARYAAIHDGDEIRFPFTLAVERVLALAEELHARGPFLEEHLLLDHRLLVTGVALFAVARLRLGEFDQYFPADIRKRALRGFDMGQSILQCVNVLQDETRLACQDSRC